MCFLSIPLQRLNTSSPMPNRNVSRIARVVADTLATLHLVITRADRKPAQRRGGDSHSVMEK